MKDRNDRTEEERAELRNERRRERMYKRKDGKTWDRSHIKCLPFVERESYDRRGHKGRDRSPDEMIRILRKRMSKSGILEKYHETRFFEKPSVKRQRKSKRIKYENQKRTERERELRRVRGDSR